ncbi:MAG: hypothetical protein WCG23_11325 [bacterium]
MNYKIINKKDNRIKDIPVQPTLENLIGADYYPDWIEVPAELYGKDIEVIEENVVEKTIDLEKLKREKFSEVESGYINAFLNGLDSTIGIKMHIKPDDQLNYIGAMIATTSLQDTDTLPFPLIDFYGATQQMTVGQSRQAYLEIVNYKAQMEVARATLLAQIANAQSQEELPIIQEVLNNV